MTIEENRILYYTFGMSERVHELAAPLRRTGTVGVKDLRDQGLQKQQLGVPPVG